MPHVYYTPAGFSADHGARLQQAQDLTLSWPELVWAAVTVGRRELYHVLRHGSYSLFELSYRTAVLYANLAETGTGRLSRSPAYDGLDPSEKGAISYFLGMTITKAALHRLCSVPWLMHLDVYRRDLNVLLGDGRGRPDFVGRDNLGRWVVVESKGRTNDFDERALNRAKEQAQRVVDIAGEVPYLALGTLVHFDGGVLQLHLRDPEPKSEEQIKLALDAPSFFEGYYRPFREWLQSEPTSREVSIGGLTFLEAPVQHLDLRIGLASELAVVPSTELAETSMHVAERIRVGGTDDAFVGRDGILVTTGSLWSTHNMRQEPQARTRSA